MQTDTTLCNHLAISLGPSAAGEAAEPLAENNEALVEGQSKAAEEWLEPVKHYFFLGERRLTD